MSDAYLICNVNEGVYSPKYDEDETYSINFIPGKFEYVKEKTTRDKLVKTYESVTKTETWNFIKDNTENEIFSHNVNMSKIIENMKELGYKYHTVASFISSIRTMKFIAKHGEIEFMKKNI